jgi:hypothetical protein
MYKLDVRTGKVSVSSFPTTLAFQRATLRSDGSIIEVVTAFEGDPKFAYRSESGHLHMFCVEVRHIGEFAIREQFLTMQEALDASARAILSLNKIGYRTTSFKHETRKEPTGLKEIMDNMELDYIVSGVESEQAKRVQAAVEAESLDLSSKEENFGEAMAIALGKSDHIYDSILKAELLDGSAPTKEELKHHARLERKYGL